MNVDTALIPAAGRGTRMRPATRAVPKALLPVVDRPAVQWVVEEAVRAGAREVYVVVDPGVGELVERHFNSQEEGRLKGLEEVEIHPIVQPVPRGLGDAVAIAQRQLDGRPFYCLLVDNMVYPGQDVLPAMEQASDGKSVVCLRELGPEFLSRYGVVVPGPWVSSEVLEVEGAVEKPGVARAPSKLGLVGRYLFTSDVFPALAEIKPGVGGELQLTDAIDLLGRGRVCRGYVANADLLDSGNPESYLEAATVLGLSHDEYGAAYRQFVRELASELDD